MAFKSKTLLIRSIVRCACVAAVLTTVWLVTGGLPTQGLPHGLVTDALARDLVRPSYGGRVFCAYDSLGARRRWTGAGAATEEYAWALCQEYYPDGGHLAEGSGARLPVVVEARRTPDGDAVTDLRAPLTSRDDRQIFPILVQWRIHARERAGDALTQSPRDQARAAFGL